jgi:hypothetical protein
MTIDIPLINLFLHENYLPLFDDLSDCAAAMEELSVSDIILSGGASLLERLWWWHLPFSVVVPFSGGRVCP